MSEGKIIIHATSDLACPWCYVGYKRLENAISILGDEQFEIHWHPYMIDPSTATNGEEYMAYNTRRWGGDGWVYAMKTSSKRDGCNFSNWSVWANTLHAHRLMELARSVSWSKSHELKGMLFEKYYEQGKNISLMDVLIEIGDEAGLPNAKEYMTNSSNGVEEIKQADRKAKKLGISGVPHFVVSYEDKTEVLHGAQSTQTWTALFTQWLNE